MNDIREGRFDGGKRSAARRTGKTTAGRFQLGDARTTPGSGDGRKRKKDIGNCEAERDYTVARSSGGGRQHQ